MTVALTASLLAAVSCKTEDEHAEPAPPVNPPIGVLFCRGGPALTVETRVVLETNGIHTFTDGNREALGHTDVVLRVARSPAPAGPGGEALAPGTCAYADRAMGPGEPTILVPPSYAASVSWAWKVEAGTASPAQPTTQFDDLARNERLVLRATIVKGKSRGTYDVTEYKLR